MPTYICCSGQSECNRIITVGYLKSFIGTDIKTSGGTTVSVNTTKPDSYVPTYSELTNGTMLPKFVDGGNGKWHSNVDGITVNGTYAANQNVKQEDLVLTYTRFKGLSINASADSLDACSSSTNLCATYTLTKTVKSLNSSCNAATASTDGTDTTCKPSFSSNQTWLTIGACANNCATATVGKNGSWSANSRSCVVTALVEYKGTSYSSNTVTITQDALTGGYYKRNLKDRVYDSVNITSHSPLNYGCSGGSFSVTATGYYHDRYKWEDSCGTVYDQAPYSSVTSSETAGSSSGVFNPIECPTTSGHVTSSLTVTYHDLTSSAVTFVQDCSQSCACTGGVTTIEWDDTKAIPCHSADTVTIAVPYTATTTYDNCDPTIVTSTSSFTFTNVQCNSGATKVIRAANPKISQSGGCECSSCSCDDFSADTKDIKFEFMDKDATSSATINYTNNCVTVTASAAVSDATKYELTIVSIASGVITIRLKNKFYTARPQTDELAGTITIKGTADGTECTSEKVNVYFQGNCPKMTVSTEGTPPCSGGTINLIITK